MARGLKIAKNDTTEYVGANIQKDQAIGPQTITYAVSTTSNTTVYEGGTGGFTSGTTSLVIQTNYKTSAGVAKTDGQIVKQKGSVQFNVQSVAGGAATLTRCTLVGGASQPTLAANQMYIRAVAPNGTLFYASRITDRFVWNGITRYPYVLGTTSAITYIDGTSGVTFTNAAGNNEGGLAVVEGF
jgi:hypothetical protein